VTTDRPARPARADSREVAELKALKTAQPELASAVDMQLELVEVQRRVKSRVPLPWIQHEDAWLENQVRSGRAAVQFGDIPLDWSDLRLTVRQTADILLRYEAIERTDRDRIVALTREGNQLEPLVRRWYDATSHAETGRPEDPSPADAPAGFDQVLLLSLRPFLARCAEALLPRTEFAAWQHPYCPICGWEADFAVITAAAERRLICGRCLGQWGFDPIACPFCGNADRAQITSFATRDGLYRVYGCDVCRKYLKAYDGRHAPRQVLVSVDTIATLPLDAAAMQKGYDG
jgi:hypothetical protein